jgi:hypothetical protein
MPTLIGFADLHCLPNRVSSHDLNRGKRRLFGLRYPYSLTKNTTTASILISHNSCLRRIIISLNKSLTCLETSTAGKKELSVFKEDQEVICLFPLR